MAATALLALLGAVAYGLFRTGQSASSGPSKAVTGAQTTLVDQSPLRTAQKLGRLADSPEEQALSREAIRLADHELDLAYESARRNAEAHPPVLSPEAKKIQARLEKAQELQKADQGLAAELTAGEAKASERNQRERGARRNQTNGRGESDGGEVSDAAPALMQPARRGRGP